MTIDFQAIADKFKAPMALSRARKIDGFSKRDVAVLSGQAVEIVDAVANHRDFKFAGYHKRRRRSRWIDRKTDKVLTFYEDNSRLIFGDALPLAA